MTKNQYFSLSKSAPIERIAKRIARAGVCSRREAEARIADGRVSINGKTITSPALNVDSDDRIIIDGKPLPAREPTKLWRYYKPRGLVVSARDEKNRETVFDRLPTNLPRLIAVGRLDMDSEGLLLLTNDGELARHLELPATGWSRKYRVRVQGEVDEASLDPLSKGVTINGVRYGSVIANLDRQMPSNAWLTITIREGKNREVRRIMERLGHRVLRLIRTSYGPFQLGELCENGIESVKSRVLADQLGITGGEPDSANDAKPTLRANAKPKNHRGRAGRSAVKRGQNADYRGPTSRRKTGKPRR